MLDRFGQFTNRILNIFKTWNRLAAEEMERYNLNASHVQYLVVLLQNLQGLTSQELIDIIQRDKSDVSRNMKALMEDGLLEKTSTYQKGYGGRYYLTSKGKEIANEVTKKVSRAVYLVNEDIDQAKLDIFYEVLELLTVNISNIKEEDLKF